MSKYVSLFFFLLIFVIFISKLEQIHIRAIQKGSMMNGYNRNIYWLLYSFLLFIFFRFADVKAKIASKFTKPKSSSAELGFTNSCYWWQHCLVSLPHPGKYHDLERQLIQEFTAAQRRGEIGRMREVAAVLLHFKVTLNFETTGNTNVIPHITVL